MLRPQSNALRDVRDLNGFWEFWPQDNIDIADPSQWCGGFTPTYDMAVPGSWNEQYSDLYHYFGYGWYQRRISIPAGWAGQSIFLRVGSANYSAEVWVDGVHVGSHEGGHLPFMCDLSAAVKPGGEHLVVIRVDARLRERTLPSGRGRRGEDRLGFAHTKPDVPYDFFPYSGLHRSVQLVSVPKTHFSRVKVDTLFSVDAIRDGAADATRFRCAAG